MSETPSASSSQEIQINIKGPNELKLQIEISLDKTVGELKEAIAAKSDVEAARQRLIYSGRVLKDDDLLSAYKIQSAHTIHMVKGAARPAGSGSGSGSGAAGASSSSAGVQAQRLPSMQAGQNPTDPLTVLNGPMGHGVLAGFNPFADMGLNPNDPNMMQGMLNNPQFLQQMSSLMSNPALVDQVIASNPQLAAMGPHVRQMMQSDAFRQMMSDPQMLQSMMRMSAMMRGDAGGGGFGGGFGGMGGFGGAGAGGFPAPGVPSYAQGQNQNQNPTASASGSPRAAGTGTGFNPSMYPPFPPAASSPPPTSGSGTGTGGDTTAPAPGSPPNANANAAANPFVALSSLFGSMPPPAQGGGASPFGMVDPALVQSLLGGLGGTATGTSSTPLSPSAPSPFASPFAAAAPAPADTRPPEERFQVQLQQLQDMGFTNAAQNVRALLATAGNVHAAIEYILGGGGL